MENKRRTKAGDLFSPASFFVLRTPLFPFDEFLAWSNGLTARRMWEENADQERIAAAWENDCGLLRSRLLELLARREVAQALFIASPSLEAGLDIWRHAPDSRKGLKAERALVRYFARMCCRPTPFGLFSGCSLGQIANGNDEACDLRLGPLNAYRTCTRLDFDYLFSLTAALAKDPAFADQLRYQPNSSLHITSTVCHYIESRAEGRRRTHHMVKVRRDRLIDIVLERARDTATIPDLVATLLRCGDCDCTDEEARDYVNDLIQNGVLVSSLMPLVTGASPIDDLIGLLEQLNSDSQVVRTLVEVRDSMAMLDRAGVGVSPTEYKHLATNLEQLPGVVELTRLYQVDMIKPVERAFLSSNVIEELMQGVDIVCQLGSAREHPDLRRFRQSFLDRYESALVPLLEALDEETGIGFGTAGRDSSMLVGGLRVNDIDTKNSQPAELHPVLLRQVIDCFKSGQSEIELDTAALSRGRRDSRRLPDSFAINATLCASSTEAVQRGHFNLRWRGVVGPNGARYLGRFCHADANLYKNVTQYIKQEEDHDRDAIYAEIVHLPEGRIGNILCRPPFRKHELVYLGRSALARGQQIPVDDLLVSIEDGTIVLRSKRLQRRIIPRMTNAHNFTHQHLAPVYRFLCFLQYQNGVGVPDFSWDILETLDFLPTLKAGRLILSPARWRLSSDEIEKVVQRRGHDLFMEVQRIRRDRKLPRWILVEEDDNGLAVDLDNPLSIESFVQVVKRGSARIVQEMAPFAHQLCVSGPEGHFCHELNVPFIRHRQKEEVHLAKRHRSVAKLPSDRGARIMPPGSEWLFVKVYGGVSAIDDVLITTVPGVVQEALATRSITRWFFVRYADPHHHLRIRFNGPRERLACEVLPLIAEALAPLCRSGAIWKFQFDTYEREIDRYGGEEAMSAAEDIFFADSEAVSAVLRHGDLEDASDTRLNVALLGIDMLLSDCGFDLSEKQTLMIQLREGKYREHSGIHDIRGTIGEKFRDARRRIEALLDSDSLDDSTSRYARTTFTNRSQLVRLSIKRLQALERQGRLLTTIANLAESYVHMHANRIFRSSARSHELILYDFLSRTYESRNRRGCDS